MCVNCDKPCIGSACPYNDDTEVTECACCNNAAVHEINGTPLCDDCVKDFIEEEIHCNFSTEELCKALNLDYERIE